MAAILGPVRLAPMLLAAGLAGCEVYSSSPAEPCPGNAVAFFSFATPPDGGPAPSGSTCPFAGDPNQVKPSLAFTAEIRVSTDGGAALCRTTPHARQWLGTLQGDRLDVSVTDLGGGTPSCGSCALAVVERVAGDLQRDGGVPVSFSGELVDTISPEDPSLLDGGTADGGVCGCSLPCDVRYGLVGTATDGG
ncbi:MAG TPA: hypothetical protein VFF02_15835 [Anaeromyxobacteraceae bacterium]|nr:hypothetical protein [Anaeromyxobacteraceae bacterium]